MNVKIFRIFLAFFMLAVPGKAEAFDTIKMTDYCDLPNYAAPLRQTLLIIDGNIASPNNQDEISKENKEWISLLTKFANPVEAESSGVFLPREQITIYLLPQTGAEPLKLFEGCMPFYAKEETAQIEKQKSAVKSAVDTFFGTGVVSSTKTYANSFYGKELQAFMEVTKSATGHQPVGTAFLQSSFIKSLRSEPKLVNLSRGTPRILFVSNLNKYAFPSVTSKKAARLEGFKAGSNSHLDLSMAETYVVGTRPSQESDFIKEYIYGLVLKSNGFLYGLSQGIGQILENPVSFNVYTGHVEYPGLKVPMSLRLAADANGRLINSWVEISLKDPVSVPLTGTISCPTDKKCTVIGDGKLFAQAWAEDPDAEPVYGEQYPFAGLRNFEAMIADNEVSGRVWDAAVGEIKSSQGSASQAATSIKDFKFFLSLHKEGNR